MKYFINNGRKQKKYNKIEERRLKNYSSGGIMSKKLICLFILSLITCVLSLNAASLTINDDIKVDDLTINASSSLTHSSSNLTVNGNFTNNGTFNPNSNTLILDGTSQTLSGDINFYNLTKTVASADVLTFGAGDNYTISNTL